MKSQPLLWSSGTYTPCEPAQATHLKLCMPGPIGTLILPVMIGGTRDGTPNWTWNGSVDAPTLKPSILSKRGRLHPGPIVCHSFLNDGKVRFLDDTTHELRGQTVELPDLGVDDV